MKENARCQEFYLDLLSDEIHLQLGEGAPCLACKLAPISPTRAPKLELEKTGRNGDREGVERGGVGCTGRK